MFFLNCQIRDLHLAGAIPAVAGMKPWLVCNEGDGVAGAYCDASCALPLVVFSYNGAGICIQSAWSVECEDRAGKRIDDFDQGALRARYRSCQANAEQSIDD